LLVLVFGIVLAAVAVSVLAPGTTAALMEALEPLGVSWKPTRTTDDGNAIWYVVFSVLAVGFFAVFVAPLLFPKARSRRETMIKEVTGNFSVLQVFVDQDKRVDRGLDELRQLSEEVKRGQGTPQAGLPAAMSSTPVVPHQTGKEAAIAAVPTLEPLGVGGPSEEPTMQVSRQSISDRFDAIEAQKQSPEGSPVIRKLEGVRAADYRAPEPVAHDDDATIVRSDAVKPGIPMLDELDEPTNVIPDRKSILQRAAEVGPDDPTQLREALDPEDLRATIGSEDFDPAGPDAITKPNRD
jgi:hypothetical protein